MNAHRDPRNNAPATISSRPYAERGPLLLQRDAYHRDQYMEAYRRSTDERRVPTARNNRIVRWDALGGMLIVFVLVIFAAGRF